MNRPIPIVLRRGAGVLLTAWLAAGAASTQSSAPVVVAQAAQDGATQPGVMNRTTLVLDASHGGADSGGRISAPGGSTVLEKDVTLALALRLQALLTARGFTVVMTRTTDDGDKVGQTGSLMSLDDRAGIANHARAAACLLLHAAGSGHGVHLYSSELDGVSMEAPILPWPTAQAAWVSSSAQLEKQLGLSMQQAGVPHLASRASVRPLDSLTCPAVVVELAPEGDDVNSVKDGGYQQRVAEGLARGLEIWSRQVQPPARMPSSLGKPATPTAVEAAPKMTPQVVRVPEVQP